MSKHKRSSKASKLVSTNELEEPARQPVVDRSPKVYQRDKLAYDIHVRTRDDLTARQLQFIDLVLDRKTKLVFVDGPAGTSKTFLSVYCGLLLLQKRSISDILYIRSVAESASKSLGYLPGAQEDKMQPFLMPLMDKLDELLPRPEVDKLIKDERATGAPINFLRGASFNTRFIISDESQNLDIKEATTLITRLGQFSKMVVAGDKGQSDINGRSCMPKLFDLFNDQSSRDQGIHCFAFTKDDIVRSGVLRYIVERLETLGKPPAEPMFPAGKG